MQLAVVIVSYNVQDHLLRCLAALHTALEGLYAEVWVVDNASKDGSVAAVRSQHPQVRLIVNKTNLGFARACNQAIAQTKAAYVLLLNPDTEVAPAALHQLLAYIQARPATAAAGPHLVDARGKIVTTR